MSVFHCSHCQSEISAPFHAESTGWGYAKVYCTEDCMLLDREEDMEDFHDLDYNDFIDFVGESGAKNT